MLRIILSLILSCLSINAYADKKGIISVGASYIAKNKNELDSMWGMGSLSEYKQEFYMKPSASLHLDYQVALKN